MTENTALVERFFALLEAGDADGLMTLLDDDFVFRDPDSTFVLPRARMPAMLGWDIVARGRPVVSELRASGDTVRCKVRETNAFTELLGLDAYGLEVTFVVRDGRILEEVAHELVADGPSYTARFNEAVAPVLAWAERNDPDTLKRVLDDGGGVRFDGEAARALLELIHAWRLAAPKTNG